MQTFLSILLSLILGWGCSQFARQRGRSPLNWFIAGLFFGIFALILLFILPVLKRKDPLKSESFPSPKIPQLMLQTPSHAEKLWYFLDEQKTQYGPMSFEALSRAFSEGKIKDHTYVWNELMENWQEFEKVIQKSSS